MKHAQAAKMHGFFLHSFEAVTTVSRGGCTASFAMIDSEFSNLILCSL